MSREITIDHIMSAGLAEGRSRKEMERVITHNTGHVFTQEREMPKIGRNQPCPCGSGMKFKKCHMSIQKHPAVKKMLIEKGSQ